MSRSFSWIIFEYCSNNLLFVSRLLILVQNSSTFEQIKMFITRIGIDSRAVINGDADQSDLPFNMRGGLQNVSQKLFGLQGVGVCELQASDIVRNPIIGRILERLK